MTTRTVVAPTVYDLYRAMRHGEGVRIAHPTDGSAPWTLVRIMWTGAGLNLLIKRDDDVRHHTVSVAMTGIVRQ